jgi:hypothetical protein
LQARCSYCLDCPEKGVKGDNVSQLETAPRRATYEPPSIEKLGEVRVLTQDICIANKGFGGTDGLFYIPIHNCS